MKKILFLFLLIISFLFLKVNTIHAQACTGMVKCSEYLGFPVNDCSQDTSWLYTIACDGPNCTAGSVNGTTGCVGGCEISNSCAPSGPVIPGATPTPRPGSLENCPAGQIITAYDPPAYTCPASGCNSVFRNATGNTCGPGGAYEECEVLYCAPPPTPTPAPTPGQPTLISPISNLSCPSSNPTSVNFNWSPTVYTSYYYLRIDDLSNPWLGCSTDGSITPNTGDICSGYLTATSYVASLAANKNYRWWVSAYDSILTLGPFSTIQNFTIPATCTPAPSPSPTPTPVPTPSPSPTPAPCSVTTSPLALGLTTGGTGTVTASVTSGIGSANVTQMRFGSYNTGVATVNPSSDSSNPYSTTVTAVSGGSTAVWATADLSDGRTCQSSGVTDTDVTVNSPTASPTPVPTASPTPAPCFVTTSPSSASLSVGATRTITASVSSGLGSASVTNMQFGSYNTNIATVNPSSDTNGPTYSTTVTAVSSGSTAIWGTATLSDGRTCQSSGSTDTNISVTNVCTPPIISLINRISYFKINIEWTPGACDGNQQIVITQNGNPVITQTLPPTDTTYTTGNVLAPGSVYEVEIINSDTLGNETSSNSTNPAPYVDTPQLYLSSCALSPLSSQLQVSQTATITSSVDSSPQINRVEFTSSNPSVITVTSPDSTVPYTTQVTAVGAGSATISSKVYFDNGVLACDTNVDGGNSNINVIDLANSWWQLKDSDISSNGSLNSSIPVGSVFILPGAGGSSGIPSYSTTTNITSTNASSDHWICQNDNKSKPVFDYNYFEDLIPKDVTINNIGSPSIPCSTFASGGTASYGYYWYRYDGGSGHIPLHINNSCSIGDRKVVVLVKNADLFVDGSINLNDGIGFFMGIVDQSVNIDPSVGGGSGPNIEGFFIADNEFHSGSGTNSLEVRGAVVAYDGIILERDLGTGNATTPAELFEYAPDQSLLFPSKLATRKISWKEVAP